MCLGSISRAAVTRTVSRTARNVDVLDDALLGVEAHRANLEHSSAARRVHQNPLSGLVRTGLRTVRDAHVSSRDRLSRNGAHDRTANAPVAAAHVCSRAGRVVTAENGGGRADVQLAPQQPDRGDANLQQIRAVGATDGPEHGAAAPRRVAQREPAICRGHHPDLGDAALESVRSKCDLEPLCRYGDAVRW